MVAAGPATVTATLHGRSHDRARGGDIVMHKQASLKWEAIEGGPIHSARPSLWKFMLA